MPNIIITNSVVTVNTYSASPTSAIAEKTQKWAKKKKKALDIAEKISTFDKKRGLRMHNCGNYINMQICKSCGHWHITQANLCRDRFCPICNWRLSLKRYSHMIDIFNSIDVSDYTPTFLTLTIKNCKLTSLRYTLDRMSKAWNRLLQRQFYKNNLVGWSRTLEITRNVKTGEYHPHYHCLLLWNKRTPMLGIDVSLRNDWQEVLNVGYRPIVDHRYITPKQGNQGEDISAVTSAVLETSKYSIKDKMLDDVSADELKELNYQLCGKRMVAFGGLVKQIKSQLNFDFERLKSNNESVDICTVCNSQELALACAEWSFTTETYKVLELKEVV